MSYQIESLSHHGIKGMRWGIRRFQNRDGTLTLLGKKRNRSDDGETRNKPKTDDNTSPKSKSIKDMSDQELRSIINRLELEKRYKDLTPEQTSTGKKFVNSVLKNVISPAAEDVAKQLTKSYMVDAVNKAFNLSDELKVYTNNKKK